MRRIGGMNRNTLFGLFFVLFSCSHQNVGTRDPASLKNGTCDKIIENFLSIVSDNGESIDSYLNKGIFDSSDLKILKEAKTVSFVNKFQDSEKGKVELGILFISKKYPHLDAHRVIKHYEFLEEFCGM